MRIPRASGRHRNVSSRCVERLRAKTAHDRSTGVVTQCVRRVDVEATDDVVESRSNDRTHVVRSRDDTEGIKDVVVAEFAHLLPLPRLGERVEFTVKVAPAVKSEHAAIRGRRSVEGNLTPNSSRRVLQFLIRVARRDETGEGDRKVLRLAPRLRESSL